MSSQLSQPHSDSNCLLCQTFATLVPKEQSSVIHSHKTFATLVPKKQSSVIHSHKTFQIWGKKRLLKLPYLDTRFQQIAKLLKCFPTFQLYGLISILCGWLPLWLAPSKNLKKKNLCTPHCSKKGKNNLK